MKALHIAVNLTWRCQLRCAMCWIDDLGLDREAPEQPWTAWRDGLIRMAPHMLVDFSGGEPLLYPHFHKLVLALASAGAEWAVTTNMVEQDAVRLFLAMPIGNCVVWNISYHAGLPDGWREQALQLRAAGYNVALNVVLHPTEPLPTAEESAGLMLSWLPWQDWGAGDGTDGITRLCDAGRAHCVVAPDGTAYRCQVELQKQCAPMGSFVDGTVRSEASTHLCQIGCSTCYTQNAMAAPGWRVSMEAVE